MARMGRFVRFAMALSLGFGAVSSPASAQSDVNAELARAATLLIAGDLAGARQCVDRLAQAHRGGAERDFLDGMISYSGKDYRRAEAMFRRLLDRDPKLLRVRLELARTLYMERKDEQADYHFRLASAEHPPVLVVSNILRFRQAIRARRSWRFNMDFGLSPDSNVNSATDKETVDVYGLPFRLDPSARSKSGMGRFAGIDASLRLNRSGKVPIYVGAYGRWTRYRDHRFDDAYAGAEAGPELSVAGGRLRATATALERWYGERPLVKSVGGRFDYEKLIGGKWTFGGTLLVRHNDYARRRDVDGWDAAALASVDRTIGATTLGSGWIGVERNSANDPGQGFWRGQFGFGILKEIGSGLRPKLTIDVARQLNDAPLAPFGKQRDWLLDASFSIYKRDWNFGGFAPSLGVTATRNISTLTLYDQKRLRGEVRLTKAF
jgi:hypothetical protein